MKNKLHSLRKTVESSLKKVKIDGVHVYRQPRFLVQRSANRRFLCKDKNGHLIAEFIGMNSLTQYVSQKTGKSRNYIKQRVYRNLNKKIDFLGYRWTDK